MNHLAMIGVIFARCFEREAAIKRWCTFDRLGVYAQIDATKKMCAEWKRRAA